MELQIVTDSSKIVSLHKALGNEIKKECKGKARRLVFTTPAGGGVVNAFSFKYARNIFWWSNTRDSESGKFYNLFGLNPDFDRQNQILLQINYQFPLIDFNEGALWAYDKNKDFYLLHSGKMGGGIKGFTIARIHEIYGGSKASVNINGVEKDFLVVCMLGSKRVFHQMGVFLTEIKKIKQIIKSSKEGKDNGGSSMILRKYTPEFWGKRKGYFKKGNIESESDHGYIVDSLKHELELNYGYEGNCVKNKFVDLGLIKKDRAFAIFEFKTSIGSQSLYTAIGQLALHGFNLNTQPLKFAVFPNEFSADVEKDLDELGITTIRYKWKKDKIKFINLSKVPVF